MITDRLGREVREGDIVLSKHRNVLFLVHFLREARTLSLPELEFHIVIVDLEASNWPRWIGRKRSLFLRSGSVGEWEVIRNTGLLM